MPEHAWPDGSAGAGGGGIGTGAWEVVYVRRTPGTDPPDPGVVGTGVFYDREYEWAVCGVSTGPFPPVTDPVITDILIAPNIIPTNSLSVMTFSPDGGTTSNTGGVATLDAFGDSGSLTVTLISLSQFLIRIQVGEFETRRSASGNDYYFVIARRKVTA